MESIGRYRIVKEIGRGAMGIVYLATDPTIGRSVAIKTVRLRDVDNAQQREKLRERLFREARSAGVLSHPNIVTIYDMAEEDGVAYIAMEYVDGPTLDDVLNSAKPLESAKLFGILRQTAIALDYAHTKGIVHRDIKPANIMLGRDGNVKVTDFGIAKINTAADSFTMTGTLVGTPNYMSPEQVQGTEVTGRSDQFSLAVIAYEILTGERPFPGEQLSTVVYKIVAEEPLSPQKLNRTLGAAIDGVLRKALAKKPANRYRTCAEFVGSLETTCAATKGWLPMQRGAGLNQSTMSAAVPAGIARSIPNPPARKPKMGGKPGPESDNAGESKRNGESVASPAGAERRKESKVLPLAAALLVVIGVLSMLTWQSADKSSAGQAEAKAELPSPPPAEQMRPSPAPAEPVATTAAGSDVQPETKPVADPAVAQTEATAEPKVEAAKVEAAKADKPSAMGPANSNAAASKPSATHTVGQLDRDPNPLSTLPRPAGKTPAAQNSAGKMQDLAVATNPDKASAILDGGGANCVTPCTLQASPGLHSLSFRLEGYQEERREIHVGNEAQEYPLISLRKTSGTLMINTIPAGATITINDKAQSQTTPARIELAPGTYTVMVEKNGKQATDRVEIRNGNTNFVKIPLN